LKRVPGGLCIALPLAWIAAFAAMTLGVSTAPQNNVMPAAAGIYATSRL
jgi:hypothetical protein